MKSILNIAKLPLVQHTQYLSNCGFKFRHDFPAKTKKQRNQQLIVKRCEMRISDQILALMLIAYPIS
jgi:hypothetical protein